MTFSQVYAVVRGIPRGMVASYGDVALLDGTPHGAHAVGFAMRCCHDKTVPCHRVVKGDGSLSESFDLFGGAEAQRALLRSEGVSFLPDGRVDMARCRYRG